MKEATVLPILRSNTQGLILARLLLDPEVELSLTRIAGEVGTSVATVSREIDRAERAGLVRARRLGNLRLVSADTRSPLFEPTAELLLRTYGPKHVVASEFAGLPGIEALYMFGSWAGRYLGQAGADPRDIDVLIVGTVDRDEAFAAAGRAERRLGRPVNITTRSPERLRDGSEPFLRELRRRPLVQIFPERGSPA